MISDATTMDLTPATANRDLESGAADVLRRARRGDLAAFEELMRLHERLVYGMAWRLLGVVEDSQDAAQEVFLRLYRYLDRIDPARPLAPWLYRVTVNVCRSLRRRRPVDKPLEDAREVATTDPAADPAAVAELAEEQRMVAAGLATLSGKEREALVLRDLEGLSCREVARTLGTSEVTVRTHICRGRMKLRAFRERWHRRTTR